MRIRIEGTDLPGSACGPSPDRPDGHRNIHVGVERRGKSAELLGVVPKLRLDAVPPEVLRSAEEQGVLGPASA